MKSFANFFTEAVETLASSEAKNRGLVGNGHGDWYDKQGNFIAKTVSGKLKYFGQGDTVSKDGIPGEEIKKKKPEAKKEPEKEPVQENGVVVAIGRFNPPSKNHGSLLKYGFSQANRRGYEYRIYPSRVQDEMINPLFPSAKIEYMADMFPEYADYIIDSQETKTVLDILGALYTDGYTDVVMVVGSNRLGEIQGLVHKLEGQSYAFNNIEVVASGSVDPDGDIKNTGSSALMRASVAMNDFEKFTAGLPSGMDIGSKRSMFGALKRIMKVNENTEIWKIVPELDESGLRWNYKNNGLYEIDTYVENINTGLVGKIIRRGANYLICVTEDDVMFKSWLTDVREVHEVGTDEYREYVQELTPGQTVTKFGSKIKTINKVRKK